MKPISFRTLACLAAGLILVIAASLPAAARWVEAGPIWNQSDAESKCPSVCGAQSWDGNWKTTVPGSMSVCFCAGKGHGGHHGGGGGGGGSPSAGGGGQSCSVPSVGPCPGCAISCPANQAAACSQGEPTRGGDACWTRANCACR